MDWTWFALLICLVQKTKKNIWTSKPRPNYWFGTWFRGPKKMSKNRFGYPNILKKCIKNKEMEVQNNKHIQNKEMEVHKVFDSTSLSFLNEIKSWCHYLCISVSILHRLGISKRGYIFSLVAKEKISEISGFFYYNQHLIHLKKVLCYSPL